MAGTTGSNLPPPQSPFVDQNLNLSYEGYQYLLSLLTAASQSIPTATISTALKSTGSTQATALALSSQWNLFSTTPSGSGCLLSSYNPGQSQLVFNGGANNLKIYPAPGAAIDANSNNVPYVLTPGMMQIFNFVSSALIRSTQLQIP